MTSSRVDRLYPSQKVVLREVGLRDGLQLVKTVPTTEAKQRWIAAEYSAGVRHFEIGSFLPPSRFPQFADVHAIIDTVAGHDGAFSAALALNPRGAQNAMQTELDEIVCVISATEMHSQANMRRSRNDAIKLVEWIRTLRDESRHRAVITVGISMAFGCSLAGEVKTSDVLALVDQLLVAGADVIGLADTVGCTGPRQTHDLTRAAIALAGQTPINVHMHDTRGLGLANVSSALDAGARIIDASLGGLGGCPFAPGATGNIVFEDLVFLCETKGFATGIDIDALSSVRVIAEKNLPDEAFFGGLARSGTPTNMRWRAAPI